MPIKSKDELIKIQNKLSGTEQRFASFSLNAFFLFDFVVISSIKFTIFFKEQKNIWSDTRYAEAIQKR